MPLTIGVLPVFRPQLEIFCTIHMLLTAIRLDSTKEGSIIIRRALRWGALNGFCWSWYRGAEATVRAPGGKARHGDGCC